jgi:uridine kinase
MKAAEIKEKSTPNIIAIDGKSASGKTTLANQLKVILDAQVIHMDDFFLPLPLRTAMRYEEAGGNVHYERFIEEVLVNIKKADAFSYKIFDCKKLDYNGRRMVWANSKWRIVEGAYSLHPVFGNYADLKIFFDITPAEQMKRIRKRNGEEKAKIFAARWIPFEEKYINQTKVKERADMILGKEK